MSQLYLFWGENTYLLREEKKTWKSEFCKKHGSENYLQLDASQVSYRQLLDETGIAPFIGEKRLVMVNGIPRFEKEQIESLPTLMHPASILVFAEPKPDKRLGGTKALLATATVKEFKPLAEPALKRWMVDEVTRHGSTIDPAAVDLLLQIVGEEQETLARELEKLTLAYSGHRITADAVDRLAVPSGEQEVWRLTNLLSAGRVQEALAYAKSLLERGEDPFSLWSILHWMLRSLVAVHAAAADGQRQPAAIASAMGVPFPTVRTLLPVAGNIDADKMRTFVDWAVAADIDLKTGGYKATSEAPQELLSLIDTFIVKCGALSAS